MDKDERERQTVLEPTSVEGGDPTSPEPRRNRARVALVSVRIVDQRDTVALVEWEAKGDLHRAYVPTSVIQPEGVTADDLAAGEPYGVAWERELKAIEPAVIAKALHGQGIWTIHDLALHSQQAFEALAKPIMDMLRHAIRAAKE